MMQDYVRTGTYQRAILQNHIDFKDKVLLQPLRTTNPLNPRIISSSPLPGC